MRFELIISSLQDWCLTTMALEAPYFKMWIKKVDLRTLGIEPRLYDWKSHSLPLTYIRRWLPGVEPGTIKHTNACCACQRK